MSRLKEVTEANIEMGRGFLMMSFYVLVLAPGHSKPHVFLLWTLFHFPIQIWGYILSLKHSPTACMLFSEAPLSFHSSSQIHPLSARILCQWAAVTSDSCFCIFYWELFNRTACLAEARRAWALNTPQEDSQQMCDGRGCANVPLPRSQVFPHGFRRLCSSVKFQFSIIWLTYQNTLHRLHFLPCNLSTSLPV